MLQSNAWPWSIENIDLRTPESKQIEMIRTEAIRQLKQQGYSRFYLPENLSL
ncbi:MAG: hypothetical protein HC906_16280 [Bacteroidales bacterium]|nr:hypothetical protein [Bacteroidales bacterium]